MSINPIDYANTQYKKSLIERDCYLTKTILFKRLKYETITKFHIYPFETYPNNKKSAKPKDTALLFLDHLNTTFPNYFRIIAYDICSKGGFKGYCIIPSDMIAKLFFELKSKDPNQLIFYQMTLEDKPLPFVFDLEFNISLNPFLDKNEILLLSKKFIILCINTFLDTNITDNDIICEKTIPDTSKWSYHMIIPSIGLASPEIMKSFTTLCCSALLRKDWKFFKSSPEIMNSFTKLIIKKEKQVDDTIIDTSIPSNDKPYRFVENTKIDQKRFLKSFVNSSIQEFQTEESLSKYINLTNINKSPKILSLPDIFKNTKNLKKKNFGSKSSLSIPSSNVFNDIIIKKMKSYNPNCNLSAISVNKLDKDWYTYKFSNAHECPIKGDEHKNNNCYIKTNKFSKRSYLMCHDEECNGKCPFGIPLNRLTISDFKSILKSHGCNDSDIHYHNKRLPNGHIEDLVFNYTEKLMWFIKAPKGTGKTEQLKKILKQIITIYPRANILCFTTTRSFSTALFRRLNNEEGNDSYSLEFINYMDHKDEKTFVLYDRLMIFYY